MLRADVLQLERLARRDPIKEEPMRVDVHLHSPDAASTSTKLDQIISLLNQILAKENEMASELDALTAQVTENTNAEESAIQLLNNLHQLLLDAGTDPSKLNSLAATLKQSSDRLAAAVVANTPQAAPTPEPAPTEPPA